MIIDGQEVKAYQKRTSISLYYLNSVKREVRQGINELPFAQVTRITLSSKSESLYFKVKFQHHDEYWTVSVRTHAPVKLQERLELFYINNFSSLQSLKLAIQKKLVARYNIKAKKLGLKGFEISKKTQKVVSKNPKQPKQFEPFVLEEHHIELMERAYNEQIVREGWANLTEVTKLLGSKYNMTTKELGVNKLSKAYICSGLYDTAETDKNGKKEKWIKKKL